MNILENFLRICQNYANFRGRDTRAQFWYFYLVYIILIFLILILDNVTGLAKTDPNTNYTFYPLSALLILISIIPVISAQVRRLHDTNRSAWYLLLSLIPFGNIVLLVFMCLKSTPTNQYGEPTEKTLEVVSPVVGV